MGYERGADSEVRAEVLVDFAQTVANVEMFAQSIDNLDRKMNGMKESLQGLSGNIAKSIKAALGSVDKTTQFDINKNIQQKINHLISDAVNNININVGDLGTINVNKAVVDSISKRIKNDLNNAIQNADFSISPEILSTNLNINKLYQYILKQIRDNLLQAVKSADFSDVNMSVDDDVIRAALSDTIRATMSEMATVIKQNNKLLQEYAKNITKYINSVRTELSSAIKGISATHPLIPTDIIDNFQNTLTTELSAAFNNIKFNLNVDDVQNVIAKLQPHIIGAIQKSINSYIESLSQFTPNVQSETVLRAVQRLDTALVKHTTQYVNAQLDIISKMDMGAMPLIEKTQTVINAASVKLINKLLANIDTALSSVVITEDIGNKVRAKLQSSITKAVAQAIQPNMVDVQPITISETALNKVMQSVKNAILNTLPQTIINPPQPITISSTIITNAIKKKLTEAVKQSALTFSIGQFPEGITIPDSVYTDISNAINGYVRRYAEAVSRGLALVPQFGVATDTMNKNIKDILKITSGGQIPDQVSTYDYLRANIIRAGTSIQKTFANTTVKLLNNYIKQTTKDFKEMRFEPDTKLNKYVLLSFKKLQSTIVRKAREIVREQMDILNNTVEGVAVKPIVNTGIPSGLRQRSTAARQVVQYAPKAQRPVYAPSQTTQRQQYIDWAHGLAQMPKTTRGGISDPTYYTFGGYRGGITGALVSMGQTALSMGIYSLPMALIGTLTKSLTELSDAAGKVRQNILLNPGMRDNPYVARQVAGELLGYGQQLSAVYGVDLTNMYHAAETVTRVPMSLEDQKRTLQQVAMLNALDQVDPQKAAEGLEAIRLQFKLMPEQMDEVVRNMVGAMAITNATIDDILESMKRAGPVFAQTNISPAEAITLSAFTSQALGQKGNIVGTFLKTAVARETRGSVADAIDQVFQKAYQKGIIEQPQTLYTATGQLNNPIQVLADLGKIFKVAGTDKELMALSEQLFGTREMAKGLATMFNLTSEEAGAFGDTIVDFSDRVKQVEGMTEDVLQKAMAENMNKLSYHIERAQVAMQSFGTSLESVLLPDVYRYTTALTNMLRGLGQDSDGLRMAFMGLKQMLLGAIATGFVSKAIWPKIKVAGQREYYKYFGQEASMITTPYTVAYNKETRSYDFVPALDKNAQVVQTATDAINRNTVALKNNVAARGIGTQSVMRKDKYARNIATDIYSRQQAVVAERSRYLKNLQLRAFLKQNPQPTARYQGSFSAFPKMSTVKLPQRLVDYNKLSAYGANMLQLSDQELIMRRANTIMQNWKNSAQTTFNTVKSSIANVIPTIQHFGQSIASNLNAQGFQKLSMQARQLGTTLKRDLLTLPFDRAIIKINELGTKLRQAFTKDNLHAALKAINGGLKEMAKNAASAVAQMLLMQTVGAGIESVAEDLAQAAMTPAQRQMDALMSIQDKIAQANWSTNIMNKLTDIWGKPMQGVTDVVGRVIQGVGWGLQAITGWTKNAVNPITKEDVEQLINAGIVSNQNKYYKSGDYAGVFKQLRQNPAEIITERYGQQAFVNAQRQIAFEMALQSISGTMTNLGINDEALRQQIVEAGQKALSKYSEEAQAGTLKYADVSSDKDIIRFVDMLRNADKQQYLTNAVLEQLIQGRLGELQMAELGSTTLSKETLFPEQPAKATEGETPLGLESATSKLLDEIQAEINKASAKADINELKLRIQGYSENQKYFRDSQINALRQLESVIQEQRAKLEKALSTITDEDERRQAEQTVLDLQRQQLQVQLDIKELQRKSLDELLNRLSRNLTKVQNVATIADLQMQYQGISKQSPLYFNNLIAGSNRVVSELQRQQSQLWDQLRNTDNEDDRIRIEDQIADLNKQMWQELVNIKNIESQMLDATLNQMQRRLTASEDMTTLAGLRMRYAGYEQDSPIYRRVIGAMRRNEVSVINQQISELQAKLPTITNEDDRIKIEEQIADLTKRMWQTLVDIKELQKQALGTFNLPEGIKPITHYEYLTRNNDMSAYMAQYGGAVVEVYIDNVNANNPADISKITDPIKRILDQYQQNRMMANSLSNQVYRNGRVPPIY